MTDAHPAFTPLRFIAANNDKVAEFLQGQVTCDLHRCTEERGARGAFCNRNGRVIADIVLLPPRLHWYALVRTTLLPALLELITPYTQLARIRPEVADDLVCLPLRHTSSKHQTPLKTSPLGGGSFIALTTVLETTEADTSWGLALLPGAQAGNQADAALTEAQARRAALHSRAPFLSATLSGTLTPHELNYPAADLVHFDKGCYLGQEIIARMEHLGKLKKHFHSLQLSSNQELAPGDTITTEAGTALRLIEAVAAVAENNAPDTFAIGVCAPDIEMQEGVLTLANSKRATPLLSAKTA